MSCGLLPSWREGNWTANSLLGWATSAWKFEAAWPLWHLLPLKKEMNQAAGEGFGYVGQTVFKTAFGGKETVVIMERDAAAEAGYEYKLLATKRTSTMQKELAREGENGFKLVGMTVSKTTFGGEELVSILQRPVR